jgi:hypothetical protein
MRTHLVTAFATVPDSGSIAIPGQAVNSVIKGVNKRALAQFSECHSAFSTT